MHSYPFSIAFATLFAYGLILVTGERGRKAALFGGFTVLYEITQRPERDVVLEIIFQC